MRTTLSVVFALLISSLIVCVVLSSRSKKPMGKPVSNLLGSLTIPVLGNLVIIFSSDQGIAEFGYNVYFLGMDAAVISLLFFTYAYCGFGKIQKIVRIAIYAVFSLDITQYILNPFFRFTFATEKITVDGRDYFRLIPYWGQNFHRIACYGLFFVSLIILTIVTIRASKIYVERYFVILLTMIITAAIETYYIFSRHPLDMSMIGFGIFGLLVYFFALHYRSMKVLDRLLASMASDMPEAIFFFDNDGKCIWTNEPGRQRVGVSKGDYEAIKENLKYLFEDIDLENTGWTRKMTLGEGDDTEYLELSMRSATDGEGRPAGSYLSIRDHTEEQLAIEREIYNSTHDSDTGLYTKEYFYERVGKRLKNDTKTEYMAGYFEISNFNMINDVFGSEFGLYTVKKIAETIKSNASVNTLYGRLTYDSFGILIDKKRFDENKLEKLLENFTVSDDALDHHVLIYFGVYDFNSADEIDVPLFYDSARLATSKIKDSYSKRIAYYDDKLRNEAIHEQLISNQLKSAIESKEIRPFLQPIVDSRGILAGAEALVRWIHPEEGFLNPGQFIPVFEKNGLISVVDKYMWRCACELLADWKERGIDSFISVNVSPKDFFRLDVVGELKALIEEFDISPKKLRIEITETAMTSDTVDMLKTIGELHDYGFIVEMDDFGSGYSSLNLLKDINLDLIKIDMQFLRDSERNMKANMIIKNIINMSEDLGIDTLTEGVETAKQFEKLFDMGCRLYQGYYFSKPLSVEDFEKQWFD
ncbi:MAG: EAL domain-containing protein [Saccharofermentans sp.]|nr:EAL domain-containing protein [Saccharofermentans sp.]